jgi:hypothetical protein
MVARTVFLHRQQGGVRDVQGSLAFAHGCVLFQGAENRQAIGSGGNPTKVAALARAGCEHPAEQGLS